MGRTKISDAALVKYLSEHGVAERLVETVTALGGST